MTTHSYWKAGALAMVATGLAVGVMSMPTAATAQEIGNDVRDVRQDRRDIRQDTRDIREDCGETGTEG
jgi:hypothetical protein